MWIQRNIASIILEVSKQYPVVLLTGARQVGKTLSNEALELL